MTFRFLIRTAFSCLLVGIMFAGSKVHAAELTNLVANGDFSLGANGRPDGWQSPGDAAIVTQALEVITDASGKRCARLSCTRFERQTPAAHAMLAQVGRVHLVNGRTYEFSCQLRAEGIAGRSVSVAITDTSAWQNCGLQTAFPLTSSWQTCRRVFRATHDVGPSSRLQIWFGETGTLYVADVRLIEYRDEDVVFTNIVKDSNTRNLVPNPSFELGGTGWSSMGTGAGWGNLSHLHGQVETSGGAHGRSFLRIPVGKDQTPVLYFDYYDPVVRREIRPLVANQGWIQVVPGAVYTLSCYARASREGVPAILGVVTKAPAGGRREHRQQVRLTTEWTRYSLTFNPEQRYVFVFAGPNLQQEERIDVDLDAIQLEKGNRATEFQPHQPVELAIEPLEPGGVFFDDDAGALWLRACNYSDAPFRLTVRFRVTDFEDQPVAWPDRSMEIPAQTAIQEKVQLPAAWKGFYHVTASAEAGGSSLSSQVRLAIVPRRTAQDSVCGINHAFATADLINLASRAGVSWYRDWSLKWQHMEPAKGEYHWELADAQIDRVLRQGCSVLPLLPPFPSADWSSEAPLTISTKGYPGVRARQAWAPKDPQELAGFIERATIRFKDRIHTWEFLNEPIYTDYALPAKSNAGSRMYQPADYVALLRSASTAMRKADPSCKIIGGIAGGPRQLTLEVLDAGILQDVDILNLHIYPGLRAPEAYADEMLALLKSMDAHGGRKPIWVTEFSYYAVDNLPRRPFVPQPEAWAEERLLDSERQCADYTLRFFTVMLSHGVQKIFIHSGANGTVNEPNFECALFDHDGAPRKLLPALAMLTQVLGPSPECTGMKRIGTDAHVAGFETGRQAVLVLWQAEDGRGPDLLLPSGSDLTWMDAMGRKTDAQPTKLSNSLTYLVGRSGQAAELLQKIAP